MSESSGNWKEESYKAFVARLEAQEARDAELRSQQGKFAVWLEPAADEAPTFSREQQTELSGVVKELQDNDVEPEAPFMAVDSVDAVSGYTGQLIIPLAAAMAHVLAQVLVAWVKAKNGRRIRVRVGDARIEASSVDEVERLIPLLNELQGKAAKGALKKPAQ